MKLLGNIKGRHILDLGCGEGGYARILAKRGAYVTAIDASKELIAIAEEKARKEGLSIRFMVRDAASLDGLRDGSFDTILAAMSLMDIERYDEAVAEMWRVLRLDGNLLMSILHPCFTGRHCLWEKDEDGNPIHLNIDNYFDKRPWKQFIQAGKFKREVIFRHRPLQDYINPLVAVGFRLLRFHEPVPTAEQMRQSPRFAELARVPSFLFMEWKK